MGALVFFNPEHRILVSGDVGEHGQFRDAARDRPGRSAATRATIEMLAGLDIRS
jgi:hypothetical protein